MQLFYNPHINDQTQEFTFDKNESRHIIRVLRKKKDDIVYITDGNGSLFNAKIIDDNDKKCLIIILNKVKKPKPWDYHLHIAIAPTKNIDRFEWFIEKAIEIGIDEITPIICKHSERKILKHERLQKIAESAMKQSLKFQFPKINSLTNFDSFMTQDFNSSLFIAHCEQSDKKLLKELLVAKQNVLVLIGPEGDFSSREIKSAIGKNFVPISFGESRLRTETAGLVATQILSFINQ